MVYKSFENLKQKYQEVCKQQDKDFEYINKKLFHANLKELYIQQNLEMVARANSLSGIHSLNKERVVDLLRKELENDSFVPEGVLSILTNDLKEKRIKNQEKEEKKEESIRIDEHKL